MIVYKITSKKKSFRAQRARKQTNKHRSQSVNDRASNTFPVLAHGLVAGAI